MRFRPVYVGALAVLTLVAGGLAQTAPGTLPQTNSTPNPRLDGGMSQLPPGWAAAAAAANRANQANHAKRPPAGFAPTGPAGMTALGSTPVAASSASAVPSGTPSPADLPPQPAAITFQGGLLTVHATNSSLAQILTETSTQTGMALEGAPEDERVFGDFGPAPVDKVLAELLDGGASNYLLFGRKDNQAPRALVITPRASLAPGVVMAASAAVTPATNDDDDDDDTPPPAPVQIRPLNLNPQSHEGNGLGGGPPQVRTPQQILDDMQRRRQEQQNQQVAPD